MSHDLIVGHVLKGQFLAQVFGCECAIKAKASTYVGERGRGGREGGNERFAAIKLERRFEIDFKCMPI